VTWKSRALYAVAGGFVFGGGSGLAVDAAGFTAGSAEDLGMCGAVAGFGLGLMLTAFIRDDS